MTSPELLARIDTSYDAIARSQARAETYGPLTLFVQEGPGWPLYARPTPGSGESVTAVHLGQVRARQRELGVPEACEWVHEVTPALLEVAEADGMQVLRAPLLVLDSEALPAGLAGVRLLDPEQPSYAADVAVCRAIASVGFASPGVAAGAAGAPERDAAVRRVDAAQLAHEARRTRDGLQARAIAESGELGAVATGALLRGGAAAEIAGVATLPAVRRRGLGAAVTAALARHALDTGAELVFLSAGSDQIARVYQGAGFHRVGTACIAEPAS